jgi:hypothetical protein
MIMAAGPRDGRDQTSAVTPKLYSPLLTGFFPHLLEHSKKMLAPLKTRNMLRSDN